MHTGKGLFQPGVGDPVSVDIKELVFKYLKYWYWYILTVCVCFAGAFFHVRYTYTPEYAISSTLLIKGEGNSVFSGGISGGLSDMGSNNSIRNEIIILKSRNLMQRVLSELSMNTSYFVEGKFKEVEVFEKDLPISLLISRLDPSAYGKSVRLSFLDNNHFVLVEGKDGEEKRSNHKFGQEIKKSYATFTVIGSSNVQESKDIIVRFHDVTKLADLYSGKLRISLEHKDANVLKLSLIDAVPQRSAMILSKLVEVYNQETIEDKTLVELNTMDFLDDRIAFLSTELSDVEKNVEQYKRQNELTDVSSNAQMYMQAANEYNKELVNYELQLDIINSLEDYVSQEELKLVPSSLNIQDPTLNNLLSKYNELQLERQRMLRTAQPNSSIILNLDDQLSNLKANIQENLRNIKAGLMITMNNLEANTAQFQSRISQVPSIERELLEINRQQSIKQQIYLFLLQKREETGLALASTASNSRTIDEAKASDYPVNNSNSSIYLAAILLGLFIPIASIYVKDLLNDKISSRKEVERATNMPVLGEIFRGENSNKIQVTEGNNSVIAETFRLVRTNLHFANLGKSNQVILVTSSRSGEGKSFFSVNLGASLAISGKRVLILDFDLRKSNLMKSLGHEEPLGITDYLVSDDLTLDDLISPINEVRGLFGISGGKIPPNPAELMMSSKVRHMIEGLKQNFDYIVMDSSPVGQVADTFSLAQYADSTVYIIRYNYSFKNHLALNQDIYINKRLKNSMIVLNDATKDTGTVYGYGYGYGHSNGKEKKPSLLHRFI